MKRCPACRRDYFDDSLMYCLDDGSTLLEGPSSSDDNEAATALISHAGERATKPVRSKRPRWLISLLFISAIAAIAAVSYWVYISKNEKPLDSIVVLPFENGSGDANTDYLSEGIAESLINSLTDLPQLKVIARSTAFRYKGVDVDAQRVGRELNVGAVLMGSVKQLGDTLDVQVDLVDANTGRQLWGHGFQNKVADLLTVKQTIAREVAANLKLKLSGDEQQRLTQPDTQNSEAYRCYLRGLYLQNQRTQEGLSRSIGQFQQAIAADPGYALGYVGLADSYSFLETITGAPAIESLPLARAAVDRALELDSTLAEAHTASARIYELSWRWHESENEYKRALQLNQNYARAHQWYAIHLRHVKRFDESMTEIKRAQELDPLSSIIGANVAFAYLLKQDFDSAITIDKKVLELDPSFWVAHSDMAWAYIKQRRFNEATLEFEKALELSGRSSLTLGNLGYCYAVTGRQSEAIAIARELEDRYQKHEAIGFFVATVATGLRDKEKAFAWLEKDFQQHSGQLPTMTWWPNFDDLHGDPRFDDLVRRMGL